MKTQYDVVVVGGGPAGSMTARHAAEGGASVLMLEKDREIGTPVRCAEGISEKALGKLVEIRERWIAQVINRARLIAPDGTAVDSNTEGVGYILHRKLFDCDLAAMASEAGTDVLTKAYVHGLLTEDGTVKGIRYRHMGRDHRVSSKVVVGADGVESRVGRWAGIDTRTNPEDMETCAQMTLTNISIEPDCLAFYFGRHIAPGGYLWVFPKGIRTANVGLGISGLYSRSKKPLAYLQEFVDKMFPRASVLCTVAGGVPSMPPMKDIVRDGLMLVGDAAHQSNPMSGGGIANAMIAGKIAGKVAAEAVREGDVSSRRLSAYAKEWHKTEGKKNERFYRIKKAVYNFTDEDLNRTARMLMDMPEEERTVVQVFMKALYRHPKLVIEAVKALR